MAPTPLRLDPYIVDDLLPELAGADHRPSAFLVYLFLWSRTRARSSLGVACSYRDIAAATGLAKRTVQLAVRHLVNRDLIRARQTGATATPIYSVLTPWRRRGD